MSRCAPPRPIFLHLSSRAATQRAPTAPDAPTTHCGPLVMQVSLVDEGRRLVPLVYYADGGGLYEGAAATAALP